MARTDERVTGNHAYALAIRHHQAGQLTEAERLYRDVLAADPKHLGALQYLGIIGLQSGRPALAVESIGKALALNDAMPEYHYHLGYALYQLHRLDDAVAHYQRAIALTPNYADAHLHLGNVLSEQGRFVEATACYEQVIALNPSADAHYNFANLLASQGRLHEAAEHHRRALALMPDHAEAHHGLGLIALAQGKFEDARTCFERALALNPGMVAAYNNLARAFWARGHADQALGVLRRALAVQETPETKKLFVQCAKSLGFVPNVDDFRNLVVRALTEPWCRTSDIAGIATSLTALDHTLRPYINRAMSAWPGRLPARDLLGAAGITGLSQNRLLRCLLESAPVTNVELERFLTVLRCAVLELAAAGDFECDAGALGLCCALARQCFLNEYVFACARGELEQAQSVRDSLTRAIEAGEAIPEFWLAVVAAYYPLHSLPIATTLATRPWSEPVTALVIQQVAEPLEERQIRDSISVLTPIENGVSQLVRQQYEEYPYPRWLKAEPAGSAVTIVQFFRGKFPSCDLRALAERKEIDVLVAGCGTGQHPIESAQRSREARVLAIDLSLASSELRTTQGASAGPEQHRVCPGRHSQAAHDRPDVRCHRSGWGPAPSRRPVRGMARAAVAAAAGWTDGGRALQRARTGRDRSGACLHSRARLSIRPRRISGAAGRICLRLRLPRVARRLLRFSRFLQYQRLLATCSFTCRSTA